MANGGRGGQGGRRKNFTDRYDSGPKVTAFGGGHGLSATLSALRHLSRDITAVVTVADNGGSSGRLRDEMNILPPGDLRMALSALCEDSTWGNTWRDVVQHRFASEGPLDGHAMGNLLIAAFWQILDDPVEALDYVGELLGAQGRVLPMALDPLDIEAQVENVDGSIECVRGQAQVAVTKGRVQSIRLVPEEPRIASEVLDAIESADWLILGPGSWYTSVLPHLHIGQLREAIAKSPAKRLLTMNLAAGSGETVNLSAVDLLDAVVATAPEVKFDALVADPTTAKAQGSLLVERAHELGIDVSLRRVATRRHGHIHDPLRLAAAYRDVFDGVFTHPLKGE